MRKNKTVELLIIVLLGLSIVPIAIRSARAMPVAAPGFAVTSFASGFFNSVICGIPGGGLASCGPIGIAMDASGNLYVGDIANGFVYKFGPAGGVASAATQLATPSSLGGNTPTGMAFGKDGSLYLGLCCVVGEVVQLDASTGAIIRTVTSNVPGVTAIATDPLSGDLFVSSISGGLSAIFRVSNFASGPGTVSTYTTVSGADGLAFSPDGTLYAAQFGSGVVRIDGTNSTTPGATIFIASVPDIDGMAVSANPSTPFLFGNRNDGIITKVDLSTNPPTLTDMLSGGTRGDFATVGSDGCLYATQSDSIIKVTNADGSCIPPPLGPLFPPGPVASMRVFKFFTDSSLNPLSKNQNGNPKVDVVLSSGVVKSTNPGHVEAWVNVTNTSPSPVQSLKLNDTLPVDWTVSPPWNPPRGSIGAIHVFFANTTSLATNPEITQRSTITVSTGNPQVVHLGISNFNTTAIGHPLMPGQSVLLSVKLTYGLIKTSQSATSYPRNYTDAAAGAAWTQATFTGTESTGSGSAFFTAETKSATGLCSSGSTLTIGELTDLSDGLSLQGVRVKDASLLAIDDVNSFLLSSGCNLKFAASVSDYSLDNSKALTDLQAFAAAGVQVVVGPLNSGAAQYILSFADANHIVLISPSSTTLALAIPNDYLFRTVPNDGVQGLADARMLVDRGVKAAIFLQRHDSYGINLGSAIATRFQQLGGTVIDMINYDIVTTDFTPYITTLYSDFQAANSTYPNQVAIVAISFEEISSILLQVNQQHPNLLNGKLPWFGTDAEALDTAITGGPAGQLAAEVKLPSTLYAPVSNAKTVAFESRFNAAYPGISCDIFCLNAYDDVWLAALSTLQAGSYNGTKIQAVMPTVASSYLGVTGSTLLDANGDRAAAVSSYQIWKVAIGGGSPTWVFAGTWDGSSDAITWASPP